MDNVWLFPGANLRVVGEAVHWISRLRATFGAWCLFVLADGISSNVASRSGRALVLRLQGSSRFKSCMPVFLGHTWRSRRWCWRLGNMLASNHQAGTVLISQIDAELYSAARKYGVNRLFRRSSVTEIIYASMEPLPARQRPRSLVTWRG